MKSASAPSIHSFPAKEESPVTESEDDPLDADFGLDDDFDDDLPEPNESVFSSDPRGLTVQLKSESWKCISRIPMRRTFTERELSDWGGFGGIADSDES